MSAKVLCQPSCNGAAVAWEVQKRLGDVIVNNAKMFFAGPVTFYALHMGL